MGSRRADTTHPSSSSLDASSSSSRSPCRSRSRASSCASAASVDSATRSAARGAAPPQGGCCAEEPSASGRQRSQRTCFFLRCSNRLAYDLLTRNCASSSPAASPSWACSSGSASSSSSNRSIVAAAASPSWTSARNRTATFGLPRDGRPGHGTLGQPGTPSPALVGRHKLRRHRNTTGQTAIILISPARPRILPQGVTLHPTNVPPRRAHAVLPATAAGIRCGGSALTICAKLATPQMPLSLHSYRGVSGWPGP